MLRRIDQPEVLEHEAALLGGEGGEPLPGRVAESGARACGPGREHARQMDAVADGRAGDPLLLLVRLRAREAAAGVEQPAVQPALTLERLAVESAGLALAGHPPPPLRAAAGVLGSPCSSCSRVAAIWRSAKPRARSSCGETSACRPAASRM